MYLLWAGAFVALIAWQLELQLPMHSVPITTDDMSLNLDQGEVYNSMWSNLSVTCDRSVVFSESSGFWPPQYSCNIVESDVKHHQANKQTNKQTNKPFELLVTFFILSSNFSTNFSNATILFSSVSSESHELHKEWKSHK
jgi:hypothetical protein